MWQCRIVIAALALAGCGSSGGGGTVDPDHPGLRDERAGASGEPADAGASESAAPGAGGASEPPTEPTAAHFRAPPAEVIAAIGASDPSACGADTPDACAKRGVGAGSGDAARSSAMFAAACAGGSSLGCSNLAGQLSGGQGVARDPQRAAVLYQHACRAGELAACHKLVYQRASGCLEPSGAACPTDVSPEQARPVVERACQARDHAACTTLAGYLLADERDRALRLWKDACDAGEPLACHNLADTDPRAATAVALHEKACAADFASSCMKAGLARAVADHKADGRVLVERACALGEPRGCLILDYW